VKRLLLLVCAGAAAVVAAGAAPAHATNECRGLMICVRVAGPWVVVPHGRAAPRPRVEFSLSCPRGYVVAGMDAELSDRGVDIAFLGKLGSPVGPGVTTSRATMFEATYAGVGAGGISSFRPHLGCVPASGGGNGPVPYRAGAAVVPPGEPTIRRVRNFRLHPGTVRGRQGCGAGEYLVSGWHALAFYSARPPNTSLAAAVATTRTIRGGRVGVVARSDIVVGAVRSIVQVGAVCGGAR